MSEETISNCVNVRSMVTIFEKKSPDDSRTKTRLRSSKSFSKSHPNLKKALSREAGNYDFSHQDLDGIAYHLKELEREIEKYESYSKEEHTYFQTELVTVLSEIVNIEGKNDETVAQKKKHLILVVRNLNVSLTNKLPGEQNTNSKAETKTGGLLVDAPKMNNRASSESLNQDPSGSVRNLRRIFENKCKENEQTGLNIIVNETKGTNIRRVMSFGGEACKYKYLPFRDYVGQNKPDEGSDKYIVEGVDLKNDRVIHKTNLHRYRSFREIKLENPIIVEKQETMIQPREFNEEFKKFQINNAVAPEDQVAIQELPDDSDEIDDVSYHSENDSDAVVSSGMVSQIIGKIERSISVDTSSNNGRNSLSTYDGDIEQKFDEIFTEEITQYDGAIDDRYIFNEGRVPKGEKVVVLCNPVQRSSSISNAVVTTIDEDIPHVSVHQLIKQLENNNTNNRVFHRTISSTLPNYAIDSDTSDSLETVINCPISSKTDGVEIVDVTDSNCDSEQPVIFRINGAYEDKNYSGGIVDYGEEIQNSPH